MPENALTLYEEAFRPHIYHQLEKGKGSGTAVMGLEQWKLPVELTRQLLRGAKDTARYSLAEEFFTLLSNVDAVTAQDVVTMLSVYAMTEQVAEAEALFNSILQRSTENPNYIKPNVYIYNAMLKLYRNTKQLSKARKLWDEMLSPDCPFKPNAASYSSALSAGVITNEEFSPILDDFIASASVEHSHPILSAISFSSFMTALPPNIVKSLEPRLTQARKLIPIIPISNYVAILSAYAHAGMRRQTEEIEEEMLAARLAQSPSTITTLLALYTRLHLGEHQKRFMSKIKNKKPDLHGITTVMNSLTYQGLSGTAITLFREFQKDNVFVDIMAYNSAMQAAAVAANPKHVLELMQEAKDRGLSLNITSYAMLQCAYSKADDLTGFRSSMVKLKTELGIEPDDRCWTAYLQLLKRLRAPAEDIEAGIHAMLSSGYTPPTNLVIQLLQYLERRGEILIVRRVERLAKSGALGAMTKKTITETRNEMPIGPLLKQALAHTQTQTESDHPPL